MRELTPLESARSPLAAAIFACRQQFLGAAAFSAFSNLLYVAPTLFMLQVYDRVIPTGGVTTLLLLGLVTLAALGVLGGLDWLRSRLMVRASTRLDRQLAGPILDAVLRQPALTPVSRMKAMRDFDNLRQSLSGAGLIAVLDLPWTPIYLVLAFFMHPALAALGVVACALLFGLTILNEHATDKQFQEANQAASVAYATQDNASGAADVIRALGMRRAMVSKHLRERSKMMSLQTRASFTAGGYLSLIKGLRLGLQSVALGLGAYLAINGQLSAGAIFAASFLLARMLAPIEQVVGAWKSIALGRAAYDSLNALLEAQPTTQPTMLPAPSGRVSLRDVSVFDPSRSVLLLEGLSFTVEAGQMIGIIGPSGAGKSTLARVLSGVLRPDHGSVRIDSASVTDWDEEALATQVGYLPQNFILFAGTIKENICRFESVLNPDQASVDGAAVAAAKLAGAHEMILQLPRGYDTPIGVNGAGVSAGQAQRIALARALYRDPRILIFDEPNAHLDGDGEAHLIELFSRLRSEGRTLFVVAHRNNVLADADKILLLRNGQVSAFGTMAEMLAGAAQSMQAAAAAPSVKKRA